MLFHTNITIYRGMLRSIICLRSLATSSNSPRFAQRSIYTTASRGQENEEKIAERRRHFEKRMKEIEDHKVKARHIGILGGFFAVLFGTQAYVLWKRRSDYYKMNEKLPPIKFEEFNEEYLKKGLVNLFHPKTIYKEYCLDRRLGFPSEFWSD